jgi:DNA-binding transcriptional regulator LsrR (DeoR family)
MNERIRLMIKISKLYYESNLTQAVISRKLRLSRPTISRLLRDALETGIVKISIAQEPGSYPEIEREIENRFGLLEVVVTDVGDPESHNVVSQGLGIAAANYFSRVVQDGDIIGLTWGSTLAAMVDNLQPEKKNNVEVIQMVGGLGEPSAETHATDLVRRVSAALGATLRLLPAPGIMSTVETARLLRSEPYISQALDAVKKVDIAFAGIGAATRNSLLIRSQTIITWDEVNSFKAMGAVGEIGLHFFDQFGNLIHNDLDERIIGISLATLSSFRRVVGIAGGSEKFKAILGALRGHYINILITDLQTAKGLLDVDNT